jgi:hypothetical protein
LLAFGFYTATTKADVTGSFGVNLGFAPIDCRYLTLADPASGLIYFFNDQPCEETVYKFDFETDLNINIAISGLTMGLHSHAGTTGFEDIILTFAAKLGALDITDMFVFAQPFAEVTLLDGQDINACIVDPGDDPTSVLDDSCQTLFVKKRVDMSISLGGVTFSNLAMFEDVTFPNYCLDFFIGYIDASLFDLAGCIPAPKAPGQTYSAQSQTFGFGDVVTIEGQTPSGITVTAETGICAEQLVNAIKKHSWDLRVNADCVGNTDVVKPPMLFSFEKLYIEGIPLAAGLTLDTNVLCGSLEGSSEVGIFFQCNFSTFITLTGTPIFNSISIASNFENILGPATFTDVEVIAAGGPLFLLIDFSPLDWTVTFIFAQANFTINPDTNPASLRLRAIGVPDLVFFDVRLSISRAGLNFFADLDWDVDSTTQTFDFDDLTFGLSAEAGIVTVDASVVINEGGTTPETSYLAGGEISFSVSF